MDKVNAFRAALTALCAALTALWGWFGWLVFAWVVCMLVDYLTGSAAACKNGEWASSVARDGIWHKTGQIVSVLAAGLLDLVVGHLLSNIPVELPFAYTVLVCPLILVWYIMTELGSIIENAGALGAPIPPWLARAVAALQDAVDEAGDKIAPEEEDKTE